MSATIPFQAVDEHRSAPGLARLSTSWLTWKPVLLGLMAVDLVAILSAFALAYLVRFQLGLSLFRDAPSKLDFYVSVAAWALPAWIAIFAAARLYDARTLFVDFREYNRVAVACTLGTLAIIIISFLYDLESIARAWLLLVCGFSIVATWIGRFLFRRLVWRLRAAGHLKRVAIVVGANEEGRALANQLLGNALCGLQVIGFVDCGDTTGSAEADGPPILGRVGSLGALIDLYRVEELVIAMTALSRRELLDLYRVFGHDQRVQLRLSSGLFEILTTGAQVQDVAGIPLMSLHKVRITGVDAVLKETVDRLAAGVGLLVLSPLFLLVALAVRLDARGPIFHRRRVLGRNGTTFDAFKFRTMIPDRRTRREPITFEDRRRADKTDHDPRVTRIGRFLRRTSLDELPQLVNVLRGEMSLVGPRMIAENEITKFGKWQLNLLTVKPGITGPWQVRGRATIPYEERVRLNMEYIRDYTIWQDLQILLRTVPAVLRGRGAF